MHVAPSSAQRELRDTVHGLARKAFGQSLIEFQGNRWRRAVASAVEAARLFPLRTAFLKDRGLSYTRKAASAGVLAAETAMTLATQAVPMHGGYGYTRELAVDVVAAPLSVRAA